jgi:hypothetical protein
MYYDLEKLRARDSPTWIHTLNISNTTKVLDDMQITDTRLMLGGEERWVRENSNKQKLNLYLDLCNDKHAFGLVFRV